MSAAHHALVVVLLAVALDLAFGDPPNAAHPVAWMGRALAAGRRLLCRGRPLALLLAGGALTLGVTALAGVAGWLITVAGSALGPGGLILEAAALKSTLAVRGLTTAARAVAGALEHGDLDGARADLSKHLVSRPTAALGPGQVAAGAIESVAENLTDAFVGPVLFYLTLGLPGALAYRSLNTADSMLGYREGALEYFGKAAARLDDVANLVPARIAALALVIASGTRARAAWSVMLRDHRRTASPNAGWTMAAMAGALGVVLAKPGAYTLGDGEQPVTSDIERGIRLVGRAEALVVASAVSYVILRI